MLLCAPLPCMLCYPELELGCGCALSQAAFLLPWRRVFNLSDSQLLVARRENAKALFRGFIDSRGGTLQARMPHRAVLTDDRHVLNVTARKGMKERAASLTCSAAKSTAALRSCCINIGSRNGGRRVPACALRTAGLLHMAVLGYGRCAPPRSGNL